PSRSTISSPTPSPASRPTSASAPTSTGSSARRTSIRRRARSPAGMGHCLHHHRLFVAAAADMCEGCLSSSKNEMKDAEETGSMACSCCKALNLHVHISSSREFENTHTTASRRSIHPVMDPSGTSH
uniref:Uncharacterized protein n=1 Tax=Triticum urartu TaxID=4572 RepID=A0A8R7TID5_TRIUA